MLAAALAMNMIMIHHFVKATGIGRNEKLKCEKITDPSGIRTCNP